MGRGASCTGTTSFGVGPTHGVKERGGGGGGGGGGERRQTEVVVWWHEDPREGHTTGNTRQANPNYSCVLPPLETNVVVGERRRSASFEGGARDPNGVDAKQGEEEE